jgi:hypothetical protein
MDIKNTSSLNAFQEQTLKLTFKSQTEIDIFYGLFNHTLIGKYLRTTAEADIAGDIRSELRNVRTDGAMEYYRVFDGYVTQWGLKRNHSSR